MPLPALNKQQLFERVETCYRLAEHAFQCQLPRPQILFNQGGKTAGSAVLQLNTLRFHPKIFAQNHDHYLTHVVAHEVAHLVVWQRYGKVAPHGRQWQHVMTEVFKLPATRTHSYDTSNLGIKTVSYQCPCSTIDFTMRRHNNVLKGTRYLCRRCRKEFVAAAAG